MTLLSVESKLFFLFSRPALSESDVDKEILKINRSVSRINVDKIIELALLNGTAGFLYKNIRGLNLFPEQFEKDLRKCYIHISVSNRKAVSETLQALSILDEGSIAAIPLKGAYVSDVVFGDLGVYPSSDIDILIQPSQLPEVKETLCGKAGYVQAFQREKDLLSSHYHLLFNKKDHLLLEVHWNLVKRYFDIPASFWWRDSYKLYWRHLDVPQLAVEKNLMYTVFRLFDHCYYPFKFFVIIAGIIEKYSNEIDWEKLLSYCAQYKMKRLMIFTLKLLNEVLNVDIPAEIIKNKVFGYNLFKKIVLSGITSGINRPHLRMMAYSLLLESPLQIFKVLLGRIFPSQGELRLRYDIQDNSKKVYFYYLLNPFLLFLRKNDKEVV